MTNLPKAGVQLVADNFAQFISTLNQSNQSVQQFAQQSGVAMNNANSAFSGVNTGGLVAGVDSIGNALRRQDAPISGFQLAMAGAFLKIGAMISGQVIEKFQKITSWLMNTPNLAADFSDKMNRYFSVADEGAQNMQGEMRDLVLTLGKELPVSTLEVADMATEMAKGGLTAATLQAGALRDGLNFATSAGMGLAEAGNLLIKQMGTFVGAGASAEEQALFIRDSMNLLTQAANTSTVDVDELAHGMLQAGGTAKAVGLDYKDFVGAMGAISSAFPSAAEAGTSFKNFLLRLQPQSDKAYDQMAKLGLITLDSSKMLQYMSNVGLKPAGKDITTLSAQIANYLSEAQGLSKTDISKFFQTNLSTNDFYTAEGKLKDMSEVAGILQNATKDLTDQERAMAFSVIFGNDAMTASVKIAELGASGLQTFQQQMSKAKTVSEMYDAVMKGTNAASTNFQGTIETLGISIGSNFEKPMENAYMLGNQVASTFLTISEALRGNYTAYDNLSGPAQNFVDFMKSLVNMWPIVEAGFKGNYIGAALTTLSPTIAAIVPYIISLKKGAQELAPKFQPIVDAASELGIVLTNNLSIGMNNISSMFNYLSSDTGNFGDVLDSVLGLGIDIITRFLQVVTYSFTNIGTLSKWIASVFQENQSSANDFVLGITTAFSTIVEVARFALALLTFAFTGDTTIIVDAWNTMTTRLGEIWSVWWDNAKARLVEAGMSIYRSFDEFVRSIPDRLLDFAFFAGQYVGEIRDTWVNGFTGIWNAIEYLFTEAPQDLIDALSTFPGKITLWITNTWKFMKQKFTEIFQWKSVGESITTGITDSLWENIDNVYDAIIRFGAKMLEAFKKGLKSKSPSKVFIDATKSVTDGIVVGLFKNQETVMDAVNQLAKSMTVTFDKSASAGQSVTTNVYNQQSTAYNLGVTTNARAQDVVANFQMLQVMT